MSVRFTRGVAILLAAVTLTAGGCAYLDVKQREWIFRPQRDVHATPADVGLRYDELWLTVAGAGPEGERVHGWWIPAADARAPTMLYLHGARWSLSNNLHRIGRLHRMGFAVLAIDYRGFGRSDGDLPSEAQAYADAQAAWNELRRLEPDPTRRFVYGHSLGGAVAIELATRNSDVGGVIVESSFTSIRDMVDALGYTTLSVDALITQRFDSLAKVPAVSAPILFVHGTADRFVPPTMTEKLYAAAREPKRLLLIENGNHRNSTDVGYDRYLSAMRELVDLAARLGVTRTATPRRSG
jgi:alpha-beta hydrolase superfamily lysophospholipase